MFGPTHTCHPEGSTVAGARAGSAAASSAAPPGQNHRESQAAGWREGGGTVTHQCYATQKKTEKPCESTSTSC